MKKNKLILLIYAVLILMVSCRKADSCRGATLYYLPSCATIKGYVVLDDGNITKVFRHNLDPQFRGSGIRVCITYAAPKYDNGAFTADCISGEVITLTSIENE
jgi:hypothetical protein